MSPRLQNVHSTDFEITIDDVGDFASELVYLATEEGYIRDTLGRIAGEAGTKWVDQSSPDTWETCDFDGRYEDPVAFAQVMTHRGPQPCHTRLKDVGSGSLDVKVEE
ncbi:hypothetical protein [Halobaculum sp. EA56]|uniref:hypothetical protein n=1 Tax=Halobaculum sp. EA56 TaxID=3421648 RepID=UPI003EBCD7EE